MLHTLTYDRLNVSRHCLVSKSHTHQPMVVHWYAESGCKLMSRLNVNSFPKT